MNKRRKKKLKKMQFNKKILRAAAQVETDMTGYEDLRAPADMYDRIVKELKSRGNTFK